MNRITRAMMAALPLARLPALAVLLLALLLPTSALAASAEKTVEERPRIGLVLSGGGARGLAHVGVLRVLEENHIPVDMIAGTSAGSIVAGLYAMGLPVDEIEKIILNIDWNEGFSDTSERKYRSFLRKQDDIDLLITLPAGVNGEGMRVPKGLLQGQRLELLLKQITAGAELTEDFDQLPIPYRAIATDIENGERVALASGDIVRAMHASMAIPGVYAPVEIDGILLVDGGLSSNLPIEVVREMGADIIIAIDISTPLGTARQLTSVLSIVGQITSLLTQETVEQEMGLLTSKDTLITPDLRGYSASSFDKVADIIAIGEQAARDNLSLLTRHSIDATSYQAYRANKQHLLPQQPIVDRIIINSNSTLSRARLASYISLKPGGRFDPIQLEEDITYLYGLGYFSQISYDLDQDEGETRLLIDIRKKGWGPNYLRAGISIHGDFRGNNKTNINVGVLATEVNSLGAEWKTTLGLGEHSGLDTEFLQPLSATSDYFVATRVLLQKRNVNVYENGANLTTLRLTEQQIAVDLGRHLGTIAEVRLGLSRGTGETKTKIGEPIPSNRAENGAVRFSLTYDNLDDVNFPHKGSYGRLYLSTSKSKLGASDETSLGALSLYKVISWGPHNLLGNIRYAATFNDKSNIHKLFNLGGFMSLSGFDQDELTGPYSALATLSYYRSLNHYFIKSMEIPMYIGATLETGNVWLNRGQMTADSLIQAGSLFVGADTYIGPVYLAYGFNNAGRQNMYFFLGRQF